MLKEQHDKSSVLANTSKASHPASSGLWLLAILVSVWFLVIHANWWEWSLNPQYSYGIIVPFLALLLFGRRWPNRPPPTSPRRIGKFIAIIFLVTASFLLALIQPLTLSNADWRAVPALAGFAGVTITLALFYLAGGTPWLRHFAFPVAFFLIAVPWPRPWENSIMSWLMLHNSSLVVEALQWMGFAAEQHGNLIAIPGSLLGVEEACSGVRSLQSGIMVALAVGEFFRLGTARRIFLLILGLFAAILGNALRSLTLSYAACQSGSSAVDSIHDSTGLAVLAGASLVVLVAGKLLSRNKTSSSMAFPHPSDLAPQSFSSSFIRYSALSLIALWFGSWLGGESWYRWHENQTPQSVSTWELRPAAANSNIRTVPLTDRTLDILLYPEVAFSEQWRDNNAWQWQSFFFRWPPGKTSVQSAFVVHDPRVCLGAAGFELDRKLPPWTAHVAGFEIPFQRYVFLDRGRPVQVFHAVVENDGEAIATGSSFNRSSRWRNVLHGRRNRGLRVLEFAVRGSDDPAAAESAAQAWLATRIQPQQEQ